MARPTAYRLEHGKLVRGTVYDYKKGDILEIHTHNEINNHCTIITNGMLKVIGDNPNAGKIVRAGEILEHEPNMPHGFEALTDARMINILINSNSDRNTYGEV